MLCRRWTTMQLCSCGFMVYTRGAMLDVRERLRQLVAEGRAWHAARLWGSVLEVQHCPPPTNLIDDLPAGLRPIRTVPASSPTAFAAATDAEGSRCPLSEPTAALQSLFGPGLFRFRHGPTVMPVRPASLRFRWPGLLRACGPQVSSRTTASALVARVAEQTHPRAVSSAELWVLWRLWHNGQRRWQEPGFPAVPSYTEARGNDRASGPSSDVVALGGRGGRHGHAPGSMSELRGSFDLGLPALLLSSLSRLPVVLQQVFVIVAVPASWRRLLLRARLGGDLSEHMPLLGAVLQGRDGRSVTASLPRSSSTQWSSLRWFSIRGGRRSVTAVLPTSSAGGP